MASPDFELQAAIVARLKAYAPLSALIGARVYDSVPGQVSGGAVPVATYPYVQVGETDSHNDDAQCVTGETIFYTIHVWSAGPGFPEARKIAHEVKKALHDSALPMATHHLTSFEYRQTRMFRDADGVTAHGVVEFAAYVEEPPA